MSNKDFEEVEAAFQAGIANFSERYVIVDHDRFYRVYPIENRCLSSTIDGDLHEFYEEYIFNNDSSRVLLSDGPPVFSIDSDGESQSETDLEDFHLTFR